MQFKLVSLITLAVATTTFANPVPTSCSTGTSECCSSVSKAGDPSVAAILAAIGVEVQDVNVPVGITCSPISIVGIENGECSASPVCCDDVSHGLIAIGCVPVSV